MTNATATKTKNYIPQWSAWCEKFKNLPPHKKGMDKDESKIFIRLVISEVANEIFPDEVKETFMYQVIDKRFTSLGVLATEQAITFLAFISKNPGKAVMFAHYLVWCKINRQHQGPINMDLISNVFPWGFPTEDQLHILWKAQKVKEDEDSIRDNLLDLVHDQVAAFIKA